MTTYRLFPSTNGPATATTYSGNFISGVLFAVSGGGNWFEGYWYWVASNANTTPVKCALWSAGPSSTGAVVPGSVVTSGTLTAGQWNYIPLPSPVQLAPSYSPNNSTYGSAYIAAIGVNGPFSDTASQFNSGDVYAAGITNGPLVAYSGTTGTNPAPYSYAQGVFATSGSDPSVTMPTGGDSSGDGASNFWVDVQVSDATPAGYPGSYRLWPGKFDANPETTGDAAFPYGVDTEIDVSEPVELGYIHYFVPGNVAAAAGLATAADVWDISSGQPVASIASPQWTTESGAAATLGTSGQWVKAAFPAGTILPGGKYRVGVFNANGAQGSWSAKDATTGYFVNGVAANGITSGPLTAPNQLNAQPANVYQGTGTTGGQAVFADSGTNTFPNQTTGTNPAQVYWVDLEVTVANTVTVTNPGNQSSQVGSTVSLQMQAADSGSGQTLTWSATGLPVGLAIGASSGLITGSPTTAGTYSVTVTATDTTNASGSAAFTWTTTTGGNLTSRSIVRTGIAQFFGGTTYDNTFRCYRNGPLMSYGLSTVRAYQPKRLPDFDYVMGQQPGRGMGAVMILELNETRDTALTITQLPGLSGGQRHLIYPVQCHVFHMAHQNYAEDAEADVDELDQAIHEHIYSDPTLGGICYQAGIDKLGIRTLIDQPEIWDGVLVTHFRVVFDVEVQIVVQ